MVSSLSSKLTLSSRVVLRSEPQYYETYVAFDYEHVQTAFLDEDEFKILEYLYSHAADAEEVAKEIKLSSRKCEKFLKRAAKSGFVTKSKSATETHRQERTGIKRELFARFQIPFLAAPSSVDVFVTSRCNLKCVHCFSAYQEPVDMSLEDLKSLFDQLEKMGVLEVRINGGEPLLHPEIGKILQMLENRHFRRVILTNGTLLTDEIAKQLQRANVIPTVSLDDSEAAGHDRFRGVDGTFEKTLAGLRTLLRNHVHYGINCCLHAKNLDKIESLVNLAVDYDACRIAFLDLKPIGRMKNHQEWIPSQREYETAMTRLLTARAKHRKAVDVSLDAYLSCLVLRESTIEAKKGYVSCSAGRTRLSISSDGGVYPCNTVLGDPKWTIGNLRSETLADIWFSKNWVFFRGAVKTSDLKQCRTCTNMRTCRDFYCRLLPYVTSGDPYGPSPKCSTP